MPWSDEDDYFASPTHRAAVRRPKRGEPLWETRVNHVTWSCELRSHGEWGIEAQLFRDGDFVIGHRFGSARMGCPGPRRCVSALRRDSKTEGATLWVIPSEFRRR